MDADIDYEALRQENIRKNAELMLSLGLNKETIRIRSPSPERQVRPRVTRVKSETSSSRSTSPAAPSRKSSRIASIPARSYKEETRSERTPSMKREKVYREGSRKSSRSGPGARKSYKDWGSDSDDEGDDEYYRFTRGNSEGRDESRLTSSRSLQLKRLKNPEPPSLGWRGEGEEGSEDDLGENQDEEEDATYSAPTPTRAKVKQGEGKGELIFEKAYRHFTPNLTPFEMFEGGAFGGTAFRQYFSSVLRRPLDPDAELSELPAEWLENLDVDNKLRRETYDTSVNRFGVKAGQSLEEWEKAGWVRPQDPRGWFQWYYRFYLGRRSKDDARQISRWLKACGPAGRFKKSLVVKLAYAGAEWDDESISPVVRQTLWHWAYELNKADYLKYLP
ncbi:hypothetical protein IE53DRAFT_225787 [Violaceomyces palustris]|uniref:Uncharacterized protein n=1 Tax=Violaceomyces palustris TaxID=1673888 RepID=A0ACD0NPX9_9BASI|nr:hypothetical protein IE53DRAFT_225787 [Violaceomyces palustris]